ncbi:MAG: DNA adenine methylase [Rhodoblastus sp.]
MSEPTRPVLRWHGGKWMLAPWIISHFVDHRVYVEPFGGAASVLMRKPRAYAEIYNDLDGDVVNLFRVLRSPHAAALKEAMRLTPFAREEFALAMAETSPSDPVERARRLVTRSFMGFGSNGHNADSKTGFRSTSNRSGTTPAHDWARYPDCLDAIVERLRGIVIDNRDARDVMAQQDSAETLHYVDPPYMPETRNARSGKSRDGRLGVYRHELNAGEHDDLLAFLRGLQGMVALSGYPSPAYDAALPEWRRVEREALADGAAKRTEVLWINPALAHRLDARAAGACAPLFARLQA